MNAFLVEKKINGGLAVARETTDLPLVERRDPALPTVHEGAPDRPSREVA